jgi:cell division protein FtsB
MNTKVAMRGLYYTLAISLLGVFAFVTLRSQHVIPALLTTWDEIRAMERSNAELKRDVEKHRDRVKRLKESPAELEPEFRRLLEMQKKGEVDFKLQTAPPSK